MQTWTGGTSRRSAAASAPSSADSLTTTWGRQRSIVSISDGSAACASTRPNTSRSTTSSASWADMLGNPAMRGPITSGAASPNGSCGSPARASAEAYDVGAATRISWPDSLQARAKGSSGPKWPSLAVEENSTRTWRGFQSQKPHGNRKLPMTAPRRLSRISQCGDSGSASLDLDTSSQQTATPIRARHRGSGTSCSAQSRP